MADIESNVKVNIDTSDALTQLKLLQQQISAFQQAMRNAGAANAKAASAMQQNLVNSINATGKFRANIQTIRTTAESFTDSLEKNKLSMGEYFRYAGGASKTFGKLFKEEFNTINQVARERVKDIQTQFIKLGRDANGAMKAISVRPLALDMENLGTKTQIAAQRQQLFNQLMRQGSTNLLNFGKNTQWAGRQLMVGFTVPLVMMGSAAAKAYMEIEKASIAFKRVYGDINTTANETEKMVSNVRALATEFTKYGVAVADTMDMAAKAAAMGKTGADLLAQINQANKLAVLGNVDQNQALETTISLTNAFGISADNLSGKIDFLNAVENQTVTSIEDLTIAIPKAAPVIQQLGGNVEDLTFFLTAMKEGGINASEGANALKSGLASMINPTGKASEFLQSFGINLKNIVETNKGDVRGTVTEFAKALDTLDPLNRARAIEQLFGKFQFSRISTLFKNVIDEGSQANKVAGLAKETAEELAILSERELKKVSDSPMYKFQKSVEDMKAKLAPVGEAFLKAVTPVVEFIGKILDGFNGLGEGAKQFASIATIAIAGIGPLLLMTFGLIANGVANIMKMFVNLKSFFNKTGNKTDILGEQTRYMNTEQLRNAAIAASLDQAHAKLRQTFTSEAAAVDALTQAYKRAVTAQGAYAGVPGVPVGNAGKNPRKYANGVSMVPGPAGAGDIVPALLSPGEAVIPAKHARKYAPVIAGMVAGNLPGFENGTTGAGMRQSIIGPLTQRQTEGMARTAMQLDEINKDVMAGPYGKVAPANYGVQVSPSPGHSFPAFGVGGIYQKPDGTKVFVKPQMSLETALAEMRGTEIARSAHGLEAPKQKINVMMDPTDPEDRRRFIVLESPVDEKFSDIPTKFTKNQYFKQLVASLLRGDKDLGIGNLGGNILADVGPAGVFQRASGKRELGSKINSMEEQAIINLLGVKGGAKRFFAESTADIAKKMTPAQYDAAMKAEIATVLPKLENTIIGFGDMTPEEAQAYKNMLLRLKDGQNVDWRKYQAIHAGVKLNGGGKVARGKTALEILNAALGIQESHIQGELSPDDPAVMEQLKKVHGKDVTAADYKNFEVLGNLTMSLPGIVNQRLRSGGMQSEQFLQVYGALTGKLSKTALRAGIKDMSVSQELENMIGQKAGLDETVTDPSLADAASETLSEASVMPGPIGGAANLLLARARQVGTVRSKLDLAEGSMHEIFSGMYKRGEIKPNSTGTEFLTPFGARIARFNMPGDSSTPEGKKLRSASQEALKTWMASGANANALPSFMFEGKEYPLKFRTNSAKSGSFGKPLGNIAYDQKKVGYEGNLAVVEGGLETLKSILGLTMDGFAEGTDKVTAKAKPKASVFDIDDTLLDLSSFMVAHQEENAKLPEDQKKKWYKEVAKDPKGIPAGLAALKAAQQRGNKILLMTARPDFYEPYTVETLQKLGIDMNGIKLISRQDKDYRKPEQMKYEKTSKYMQWYDIEEFYDDMAKTRGAISLLGINAIDPLKLANGVFSVPGPKGAGDVVPAMLTPGEAVIPADKAEKHRGLIGQMIAGNVPGYNKGTMGVPGYAMGTVNVPGYNKGTDEVPGFNFGENYTETNPLPVVLIEDKSGSKNPPELSGETPTESETPDLTATPEKKTGKIAGMFDSAKAKLFTQGAGTAKVGKAVRFAAGAAGLASALPGPVGDAAKFAVGPIGAAASAMSMIPGPAGMVVGALAAIATIGMQLNAALTESRKKAVEFTTAVGTGNAAMMKFEKFAKTVSASEIMDKKRAGAFSPYQIQGGKKTFGSSYMETDDGKALVKAIADAQAKGGPQEAQQLLTQQLSAAISSGVLSATQARSVAGNVGAQMGNQNIGIGSASTLLNVYGPNGENLAKEPLKLRLQVVEASEIQLAKSIDTMQSKSLNNAEANLKSMGKQVMTQFDSLAALNPLTRLSSGNIFQGLVEGSTISVAVKGWTNMWTRIEQANTSAAAFAAQGTAALETQKQMLDGLDLEYEKRIAIAEAQGNSQLAADLAVKKEQDKARLLEENKKTVDMMIQASNSADSGPLAAFGVGWWGQQDAIKETANNAITEKFKGTGQEVQAKMATQSIDSMQGNFGQQTLLKQEVAAGQIGLSQIDTINALYGSSQAGMDELTKMIGDKGIQVDQALQVAQMFSNVEDQKAFMLRFSAETDSGKSQELIDAMTLISKNRSNINLNFMMTYFQKNPQAAKDIKENMDAISALKGKKLEITMMAKYLGKDEMALLKADTSYFNKLDKDQQIIYTTSIKTTTALKGTKEFKEAAATYKAENKGATDEDYQRAVARSVTAANVDSSKDPNADKEKKEPVTPQASFLDQYVEQIRNASGWQQKLTIGFADSMKAMKRWSKDALASGAGLAQRLNAYGADANFIQAVLGGDQKDIDKIIDRATGKLTKAGRDAIKIAKQVEDAKIGMAYVTSSESEKAGKDNELYNAGLDVIAGKEKKINEKYDARVKALDEIGKAQEKNNQLQQNTMDLADALSKGDIAAAARIAMKAKQDSQKAALDDARTNLENARKAELESITVSILGQTVNRQMLEEKIEKNTATIAANKLVELDRQVAIGKNAVIAADAAQRTLEANLKIGVLPKPYNPTYGGDGSSSSSSSTTSTEPTVDLPTIGADSAWADEQKGKNKDFWANIIPDIGAWLGTQWTNITTWFTTNLTPEKIGEFVGNMWNGIKSVNTWLEEQFTKLSTWFTTTFSAENIGTWVGNMWNGIQSVGTWLDTQLKNFKIWFDNLGPNIAKTAKTFWEEGLPALGTWLGERFKELVDWFVGIPDRVGKAIADTAKGVGDWFGKFFGAFDKTQENDSSGGVVGRASGGLISRYANGGSVMPKYFEFGGFTKQGTDTIPAMLTPGEFVLKKSAVDSIGTQQLSRLNSAGKDAMPGGDSVYNYSITVNSNSSDSSDIADKVLREIQRIDSQRIRSSNI